MLRPEDKKRIEEAAAKLNSSQLEFANLVLCQHVNGLTDAQCYLQAYPRCVSEKAASVNASRLILHSKRIREYLAAHQCERISDAVASLDECVTMLSEMARADITEVASWNVREEIDEETGEVLSVTPLPQIRRFEDVPPELRRLIKSITYTKNGPKLEFYDRQKAIETLMKFHGGFTERVELSGGVAVANVTVTPDMSPDEAAQVYRTLLDGGNG